MKYTNGKWKVENLYDSNVEVISHTTKVKHNSGWPVAKLISNDFSQDLTNAKLISKAPEMYEALKEAVTELSYCELDRSASPSGELVHNLESLLKEIEK